MSIRNLLRRLPVRSWASSASALTANDLGNYVYLVAQASTTGEPGGLYCHADVFATEEAAIAYCEYNTEPLDEYDLTFERVDHHTWVKREGDRDYQEIYQIIRREVRA